MPLQPAGRPACWPRLPWWCPRSVASALGLLILLFGASQVFAELQSALNKIWDADTAKTTGLLALIRARFFSFGLVLAIGLLLLVSLLLTAALAAAMSCSVSPVASRPG